MMPLYTASKIREKRPYSEIPFAAQFLAVLGIVFYLSAFVVGSLIWIPLS